MLKELEGYDWAEAFAYAGEDSHYGSPDVRRAHPQIEVSLDPFSREDVVELVSVDEGENDGPDWLAFGRLKDGRWFLLSAGCDYTGWDCQAGGTATVANTKDELLNFGISDSERQRLAV